MTFMDLLFSNLLLWQLIDDFKQKSEDKWCWIYVRPDDCCLFRNNIVFKKIKVNIFDFDDFWIYYIVEINT